MTMVELLLCSSVGGGGAVRGRVTHVHAAGNHRQTWTRPGQHSNTATHTLVGGAVSARLPATGKTV